VTPSIPATAKDVLARGAWCHLAAATSLGPHVTPVVFAFDRGRLWLTTSRGSTKARAWRREPRTAGLIRHCGRALAFRGRIRTYDALDPFAWPSIVLQSPVLGKAATRFSVKNARFFFGYAIDAARVPLAWAPPGRVFVSVEMQAGRLLDVERGEVIDGWGAWNRALRPASAYEEAPLTADIARGLPEAVRHAVSDVPSAVVSTLVARSEGPTMTVLPGAWSEADGRYFARVPSGFADLTDATPGTKTALTVDRSSTWRASEMTGMLVRGPADVFTRGRVRKGGPLLRSRIAKGETLFRITPERIVWWQGWSSGTVAAARTRSRRSGARAVAGVSR
jgi:hypothetical protein